MGLCLHAKAPVVIPCYDARVVVENAQKPIDLFLDIKRRAHDVGLEQGIYGRGLAGLVVLVINPSCEYLVRAVLRPSLCEALELGVSGGGCGKAQTIPRLPNPRISIVGLDGVHLVQVQRQQAGLADLLQILVTDLEVDYGGFCEDGRWPVGEFQGRPTGSAAVILSGNRTALDHWVVQCRCEV